ncbi:MAG: tetratricopeptide repeat protein [Desulfobacterales bacterium]|jgi:tetratricopeptide (TPR) repeat protein
MTTNHEANNNYINGMFSFLKSNYEESIEHLSRAIDIDPKHSLAYMSRGSAYFRSDRLDEAIADFDRAIELEPKLARPYHLRGLAKERQGNDAEAIADFEKAIELDSEYGAAYYSRATLHTKMGNEDLAVEDIKMVEFLTNKNIETFANENNVWRSQHMRLESLSAGEMER